MMIDKSTSQSSRDFPSFSITARSVEERDSLITMMCLAGKRERNPAPIKIIMLNIEFPPVGGGAATANYHLLKSLSSDRSLNIDLITTSPNRQFKVEKFSDHITIYRLGVRKKSLYYWTTYELFQWSYRAWLLADSLSKKNRYDICHCWFGWPPGVIGYLLRKRFPYIVSLRGSDVPGYNSRLKYLDRIFFKFLCQIVWRHSHAVVSNSQYLRNLAKNTCAKTNIQVIYNGVDSHRFYPGKRSKRIELNFMFVGRLIERKGLIYLLEAFKRLCAKHPGSRLQIVGSGPLQKKMKYFCRENNITERVRFVGGVPHAEMRTIYQQADVLVLPSLSESLSNAALEAMACGLGLITTDTGVAEILRNNGIVVAPKSIHGLEEAMLRYIEIPDLLRNHRWNCYCSVSQMTWSRIAHDYCSVYRKVLLPTLPQPNLEMVGSCQYGI